MRQHEEAWSLILAGGEGTRLKRFIKQWLGVHRPKQYCTFVGTRSLFQHTVDRAISAPERRVVVAASTHRSYLGKQLSGREASVVLQPANRGTAVGVLVPVALILREDPDATVVIYPSDHFVLPESALRRTVAEAVAAAEASPDNPVVIGVKPASPEPDYGWIVAEASANDGEPQRVVRFVEKPSPSGAREVARAGGLWNTLIVVSKAQSLWDMGWEHLPDLMKRLEPLRTKASAEETAERLGSVYRETQSFDFSSAMLERGADQLLVKRMDDALWSDWGRPERILETFSAIGWSSGVRDALVSQLDGVQ